MFLVFIASALLCSYIIQADSPISFFYPNSVSEISCAGTNSWTKWFNTAKPSDNAGQDKEFLQTIQTIYGRDVCATPLAMQADSIGDLRGYESFQASWATRNGIIVGFVSMNDGLDYQVRFCCPNSAFNPTSTTTTTQRPMTSHTCGRAEIKHSLQSSRIFGGSHATPNSWPWQVLYEEEKPCGSNRRCVGLCGGTLIDSRHVLTAAHCVNTEDASAITITAGLHNKFNNEAATRQIRKVERIFKHAGYNPSTLQHDLTILRLAEPVQFNKYVQPVCLPGPEPRPDDDVVLIGWGALELNGQSYHELKQTKVKVVGQCKRFWGSNLNEAQQICAAHPTDGDSACQGDSGGPMLYEHNGQWVVSGVASFVSGNSCRTDSAGAPNVYVRVSAYLPWINSII